MYTNCHTHYTIHPQHEIKQARIHSNPTVFHSVGIHPWEVENFAQPNSLNQLEESINNLTLAIGECGLDKLKNDNLEIQTIIFERQIALSEQLKLPLIIHCVKAWNELHSIRKKLNPTQAWVYHGFLKYSILKQVIESGMMISLGAGIITSPKRQELVNSIPNHLLLLETDDATLEINQVYQCVAELKKISLSELQQIVTTNFKNTFKKWEIGLKEQNY